LIAYSFKQKSPRFAALSVPLLFVWGYQYDLYYGNMMFRVQKEAERVIREEPERFFMPEGNLIMTQKEYLDTLNIKEK
jgi:hypothetical protein